jgi:hypothetical protein
MFQDNICAPSSRVKQSEKIEPDCFTLENGSDRLLRNIGNQPSPENTTTQKVADRTDT